MGVLTIPPSQPAAPVMRTIFVGEVPFVYEVPFVDDVPFVAGAEIGILLGGKPGDPKFQGACLRTVEVEG